MQVRAYGLVNGRGLATLIGRGLRRHLQMWVHSLGGAAVSNLLFLVVLVLARDAALGPVWVDEAGRAYDAASFVAPGLIAYAACHAAFETVGMYLVWDKMEGVVQDLLAAPLTAAELLLGWVLGAALAGLVTGLAVTAVFLPFVDWPLPDLLPLLGFGLLGTLLFALLGVLVGLWARKWDHYAAAETFLLLPLGLLSGTFFLRQDLPPLGSDLLFANPVFHVVDGIRSGFLGRSDGEPLVAVLLLLALVTALSLVAWRLVMRGWHLKP